MKSIMDLGNIQVYCFEKDTNEFFSFQQVANSLVVNRDNKSVRVKLKPVIGSHDDFELIMRDTKNGFVFRADCYEEHELEYPLQPFLSRDGIILFCEDKFEIIHIHCRL